MLLAALSAVSWAFLAMAGTAALGLHLLGADAAGSLGTMTAAVVTMAVGGKVRPTGDVGAFGISGPQAQGAIGIAPLGVALVGALLLAWVFLRGLRGAGAVVGPAELAARVVATAALFLGVLGGLAWAGQDTVAIDSASIGPPKSATSDLLGKLPGIGKFSNGLADGLSGLVKAKTSVGFHVDTGRSLLGGLVWVLAVLLLALLASRRTPLPPGWEGVHRTVRPAASAMALMLVVAEVAGLAAAGYAAATGDEPGRIVGSALLGAPNGVWLAVPLGLFVPWRGTATGALVQVLPDPVNRLLAGRPDQPITLSRLADLDNRVWLLPVATALLMLTAGALTATRTPRGAAGAAGFAGRCALRLALVTAATLPLLVELTAVKVNANLSVLGFDAVGAGVDLHGSVPMAALLGAAWGGGAGLLGALLALATGAAGRQTAPLAEGGGAGTKRAGGPPSSGDSDRTYPEVAYGPGPYIPSPVFRPGAGEQNPYRSPGADAVSPQDPTVAGPPPRHARPRRDTAGEDKWPEPPPPPPPAAPRGPRTPR